MVAGAEGKLPSLPLIMGLSALPPVGGKLGALPPVGGGADFSLSERLRFSSRAEGCTRD